MSEIELAKIQLQMEQEELTITTGIAVAEAKRKILDKYEKLEKERSVTNIFAIAVLLLACLDLVSSFAVK
jgi:hypothetical protein